MYKLYTDKQEVFECSISLEGASVDKSQARLVVKTEGLNLLFEGKVDSTGKCTIPIKKLRGLLNENTKGNLKLEVIAEDSYFTPWESEFVVETTKKVTVEVTSQSKEVIRESKPAVTVKNVSQVQEIKKPIKESTLDSSKHAKKIVYLLNKNGINLLNINENKVKLNRILSMYVEKHQVTESQKGGIIQKITEELALSYATK